MLGHVSDVKTGFKMTTLAGMLGHVSDIKTGFPMTTLTRINTGFKMTIL